MPATSCRATATGTPLSGQDVTDSDPSHYWVAGNPPQVTEPAIDLEKHTNDVDADAAPGPTLAEGATVTWTYIVRNTGGEGLVDVQVVDDKEGAVSCPKAALAIGEEMTCTLTGTAGVGQYRNDATVTAESALDGDPVSDADPSHYFVDEPPTEECGDCEGKVTRLTLRYLGAVPGARVQVIAQRGPGTDTVFDGTVNPGGTFEVVGPPHGNPGFAGTLGTEIRISVDGTQNAVMHTSCSQEIGPGFVAGDFEVIEATSSEGGLLCPLD